MKQVFSRYFFALDMDNAVEKVSQSCHLCASLKQGNPKPVELSTSDAPPGIGVNFASDVIRRKQAIYISFTRNSYIVH